MRGRLKSDLPTSTTLTYPSVQYSLLLQHLLLSFMVAPKDKTYTKAKAQISINTANCGQILILKVVQKLKQFFTYLCK